MKVMARTLALLAVVLYGTICFGRSDTKAQLADLKTQLEQMGAVDQEVRNRLTPFLETGDFRSNEFAAVAQEMATIDAENFAKLEQIIEKYGWPDMRIVGADASNAAFLILQHGPLTAQQKLLPIFRRAAESGKARPDHLAMLEDRVRVGEGKKQLYGTQVDVGTDGKRRVPIEDPQNLDARRAAIGLPPMRVYLDSMRPGFGQEIDESALKSQDGDELTPDTSLERTPEE